MDLLAELLSYPKTELFVNFMVGHVQRFITRDGQQRVMRELFGMNVDVVLEDLAVLTPLESGGVITVHRPGKRAFPKGTMIDFT